jgi:hypothetical protein
MRINNINLEKCTNTELLTNPDLAFIIHCFWEGMYKSDEWFVLATNTTIQKELNEQLPPRGLEKDEDWSVEVYDLEGNSYTILESVIGLLQEGKNGNRISF